MGKRLSVILEGVDEERLGPFMTEGTRERSALQEWVRRQGGRGMRSEASVIRALMAAGVAAVSEELLDIGYAELAVVYDADSADAERREARRQYVERTEARQ